MLWARGRQPDHRIRMSQQTTIRKLAELVNTPVEKLLEQLAEAGMKFSGPDQVVTSTEKMKLLGFLRRTHGKAEAPADVAGEAARKITLNRRKLQEVTVSAGRSKTTVNVEVRQKRTYVKTADNEIGGKPAPVSANDERAEILRKLEESRQRNLAEQQRLAEVDRARAEELERKRKEEQAERDRVEAERKAAQAAAAAVADEA
ncbi:MAG TPA: translation initiation factor IF-2, partial [Xanthomonadaceae bacterium]|nr:translation initiation factor IF-2 [Xanthomonadaceae bacterium]